MKKIVKKSKERVYKISISDVLSISALLVSLIAVYFQFFYKNHEVQYTFFSPNYNNDKFTIEVPFLFKNTGNQIEMILGSTLLLEVKGNNGRHYYKDMGGSVLNDFPMLLNSTESKIIKLTSDYRKYLFGSLILDSTGFPIDFQKIEILDSLKLRVKTQFLTKYG
ncbi:hypothetical protein ACVWYG_003646 [Pedobacter sp. UYEF25]